MVRKGVSTWSAMLPLGATFGEWATRGKNRHDTRGVPPVEWLNPCPPPYTFRRGALPPTSHAGSFVLSLSIPELSFWLATALCAVAQVAVVRAALAGRTPGASPSPVAKAREFFWVILPAALLALLLVWTWRSLPGHAVEGNTSSLVAPSASSVPATPVASDFRART